MKNNLTGCIVLVIGQMPENSIWDDIIRGIYVRQVIEKGLADSNAGRFKDVHDVRGKYGLSK
jgi:hypothetical protein